MIRKRAVGTDNFVKLCIFLCWWFRSRNLWFLSCFVHAASSEILWWHAAEKPTSRSQALHDKRV